MFSSGQLLDQGLATAAGFALQLRFSDQQRAAGTAHHETEILDAGQNGATGMASRGPSTDELLSLNT